MINELKALLEQVTVTVAKTRGKQEITFLFKSESNLPQSTEEPQQTGSKAKVITPEKIEPIMDVVLAAAKSLKEIKPSTGKLEGTGTVDSKGQADLIEQLQEIEEERNAQKANAKHEIDNEISVEEAEALGKETRKELIAEGKIDEVEEIQPEDVQAAADMVDDLVDKTRAELKEESLAKSRAEKKAPVVTKVSKPERTEIQLERVAKLIELGFVEKPDEKQFVRGGIGLGTVMMLGCDSNTFQNHCIRIREDINKSNEINDKPKQSFSKFQTEEVIFPEPVILGADSKEESEEIMKALQDADMAPKTDSNTVVPVTTAPIPAPIPVAIAKKLTIKQEFALLVNEFNDGGYDGNSMDEKDYPTYEAIDQMRNYLKENPLN